MKWPNKNRSSHFVQLQNRHFKWRFTILNFFFKKKNWNSCKPQFHIAVYLRFLNKTAILTSGYIKKKNFSNLFYVDGNVGNTFPINAKWELVYFWTILWENTQLYKILFLRRPPPTTLFPAPPPCPSALLIDCQSSHQSHHISRNWARNRFSLLLNFDCLSLPTNYQFKHFKLVGISLFDAS